VDCSRQITTHTYTGVDYNFFYVKFYNSNKEEESDESDEITVSTFSNYSVKKIIEAGLRKAITKPDENVNGLLSWNVLIDLTNEGLMEILTRKKKWQFLHKISKDQTTTANVAYVSKPSDLSILEFIYINGIKIDYITKFRFTQYLNSGSSSSIGKPNSYTIKGDKIYFNPTPGDKYDVSFEYYSRPEVVDSLTQEVHKDLATILIYFIAAQAAYIRNNEKR
jgi:hypothetical protein